MTRLLCAADLHLHEWTGLAPVDRLADQEHVLEQIATVAREREVDALLLAGDIFHRPHPSPATLLVFQRFLHRLGDLRVVAITGNTSHDIENAERPCALELFAGGLVEIARAPIVCGTSGGAAIACLPSVPMHTLRAARNGGDPDEINADAADILIEAARDLRERCGDWPAVLLAHWSVSGASFPNGLPVDAAREPVLPASALEELDFDVVVAGHIHRYQEFPGGFYCGSPMPLDFGEAGYPHGVVIVTIDHAANGVGPHYTGVEFVPLESRPFVTFERDLTVSDDEREWVDGLDFSADHSRGEIDGAIVRVKFRATTEQARRLDTKAAGYALRDAGAALVRIVPDIVRADRARVEGLTEDQDELDAVRMWNTAQELPPEEGDELLDLTGAYLETVQT